jgi:predicted P-loop ATPase
VTVLSAALDLLRSGLSVIPIAADGSKSPPKKWKEFQSRRASEEELKTLFCGECGIGVIGGAVSGGLEIIDFDRPGAFDVWQKLVDDIAPGLVDRLAIVRTPDGHHAYFRSPLAQGNQKLAVASKPFEKRGKKCTVIVETRGEGGYVVAPGSPLAVHSSGLPYEHMAGVSLTDLTMLTDEERSILFSTARAMNEHAKEEAKEKHETKDATGKRPGDEFAARTSWSEILQPHGWTVVRSFGSVTHWQRPGKSDKGISATTGHCGEMLYVFSSNAQPFEDGRAYGKFSAFSLLNHAGDFGKAAKDLADRGFGEPTRPKNALRLVQETAASFERLFNGEPPPSDAPMIDESYAPPEVLSSGEVTIVKELEQILDDRPGDALREPFLPRLLSALSDPAMCVDLENLPKFRKIKKGIEDARAARRRARAKASRSEWQDLLIQKYNKKGEPIGIMPIVSNAISILQNHPEWVGVLGFDTFTNAISIRGTCPIERESEEWTDNDDTNVQAWFETNCQFFPSIGVVEAAVISAAKANRFDSAVDYIRSLKWDGRPRIETWLQEILGAEDSSYHREASAKWMIGAAGRILEPGCQMDYMLILEGEQGTRKTSLLRQLVPNIRWYRDKLSEPGSVNNEIEMQGRLICEMGELSTVKKGDVDKIKVMVTSREHDYVPKYANHSRKALRRCVFAGTVNPGHGEYFTDDTGNRRFWVIACPNHSTRDITPDERDQMFAEAAARWDAGERPFLSKENELVAEQVAEHRMVSDDWSQAVAAFLKARFSDVTATEILLDCIKFELKDIGKPETTRIGKIMAKHRDKWRRSGPGGAKYYSRIDAPPHLFKPGNGLALDIPL